MADLTLYEVNVAKSLERFEHETAEHEMKILRDDGLYRHIWFQKPGTSFYHYALVTWPGYLAVVGDCGDFVFCRTRDMFEWFEGDGSRINPDYWSGKLQAPAPDAARKFSREAFRRRVDEWYAEQIEWGDVADPAGLRAACDELKAADVYHSDDEHEARRLIHEFDHDGRRMDCWEWDLREYDWQFLWCCWAIVRGIERYRAATSAEAVRDA